MASPTQWKVTVTVGGKTRLIAQFDNSQDAVNYACEKGRTLWRGGLSRPHTWAVRYGESRAPWSWKCEGSTDSGAGGFATFAWRGPH